MNDNKPPSRRLGGPRLHSSTSFRPAARCMVPSTLRIWFYAHDSLGEYFSSPPPPPLARSARSSARSLCFICKDGRTQQRLVRSIDDCVHLELCNISLTWQSKIGIKQFRQAVPTRATRDPADAPSGQNESCRPLLLSGRRYDTIHGESGSERDG